MRILFAAPDRDLLRCYEKLLKDAFGEIVTAFDGVQVLSLLIEEHFDFVVMDRNLPRVEPERIIRRLNETQTPVIVMQERNARLEELLDDALPNAILAYPFSSEELISLIRNVTVKAGSAERCSVSGLETDVAGIGYPVGPGLGRERRAPGEPGLYRRAQ